MRDEGCRLPWWVGGDLQGAPYLIEVVVSQLGGEVLAVSFECGVDLVSVCLPQIVETLRRAVGYGHVRHRLLSTDPASRGVPRGSRWVHYDAIAVSDYLGLGGSRRPLLEPLVLNQRMAVISSTSSIAAGAMWSLTCAVMLRS
jgi:hypothetical protein